MPQPPAALVVIAHYDARPVDDLSCLLDQLRAQPADWPFDIRVVVNQAHQDRLTLPERHREIQVLYRENAGFNIGAWDHGWRTEPVYERYLFLQDECRVVRSPWLRPFMRLLQRPHIGLVGESWFASRPVTWDEQVDVYARDHPERDNFFEMARTWLSEQGIQPGRHVDHLQSLMLATRRDVLEKINGFRSGKDKQQAIAAEIGISRAVVALGLDCVQVGFFPFRHILHPQWRGHVADAWTKRAMLERAIGIIERGLARRRRARSG